MNRETERLLDKASRAIDAADTLLQRGDVDFASGRSYYAMFYTAEALLNERGFRRIEGDYGVETRVSADDVRSMLEQAREFLREARRYLDAFPPP